MSMVGYGQQHPVLAQLGDIAVTQEVVFTPNGTCPIRGSIFVATDMHTERTKIPTWAIVLACVFALACLLGLLFLLAKEVVVDGYVNVSVQNHGLYHVTQIPALNAENVARVRQQVAYMQSVAQWANAHP